MGYIMNEDQKGLVSMVKHLCEKELLPVVAECDEKNLSPDAFIAEGIEMGLAMMDVPAEYGGMGLDDLTTQMMVQEMCRYDVATAGNFTVTAMCVKVALIIGTEEQKQRVSRLAADGNILAFCLTESTGGSDSVNMRTTAVRDGDNYVLNGSKCFISNASTAGGFIVMAVTDKSKKAKGISCFLIERGTPGLIIGKAEDKLGLRTSHTHEIVFENCVVPAANRLGDEGLGFIGAMKALDAGRISAASMGIGLAQRALEEAVRYAKQRIVFGQPIAEFQAISFMLADMDAAIESCRALLKHVVELREQGLPWTKQASMLKMLSTDTAMKVAVDAVQIFGGYGACKEYPVEKLMRDAKILQIVEGSNQIQRGIIAKNLLKEY